MCIIGEAGGFRDHFGAEKKKEKKTGSNVATSSQQKKKSMNVSTSRRRDVATSRCRDVATLRRHRDFCLRIIKSKGDLILRSSKNVRRRARKTKQQ